MAYVSAAAADDGLFIVSLREMIMCMKYNICIMNIVHANIMKH